MDQQQITAQDQLDTVAGPSASLLAREARRRVPIISPLHAKDAAEEVHHSLYKMQPQGWITVTASVGQRAYALTVIGDSMEPKFPEGVTIIVDPDVRPVQGSFVVALLRDTDQVTFKQFVIDGRHYLKPLNPRYPIMEIDDHVALCGVVKQMIMTFE